MPTMIPSNDAFLSAFETVFRLCLKPTISSSAPMGDAIQYACLGGGKRVRPTLCYLSSVFCDVDISVALDFAIPIEMIHSYSLIHDDLPCMDNDDIRRGKPTVHKKYGESIALLAGDALLNAAYEFLFSRCEKDPGYIPGAKLISDLAGVKGMIGGQAEEFIRNTPTEEDVVNISLKKTGALLQAALCAPATFSFNPQKQSALSSFGKILGLCFQITDDLLDAGKNESFSYVTVCGERRAREQVNALRKKAHAVLSPFDSESNDLLAFFDQICTRSR